jgi:hypothetical protein
MLCVLVKFISKLWQKTSWARVHVSPTYRFYLQVRDKFQTLLKEVWFEIFRFFLTKNTKCWISPRIFVKFRNDPNGMPSCRGETDSWKNLKLKILCQTSIYSWDIEKSFPNRLLGMPGAGASWEPSVVITWQHPRGRPGLGEQAEGSHTGARHAQVRTYTP